MKSLHNTDRKIAREESAIVSRNKAANGETCVNLFLVSDQARKLNESKDRIERFKERRKLIKAIFGRY